MGHDPVILHADMDAFYASVEQRDRPELRGRPVVVGGVGGRGVVSAASYEARRFGVHSAMPTAEARARCPDGVFLPGDMAGYARVSKQVFAIFREMAPRVEGLSIDEAFLDLTGSRRLLGDPVEVGHRLRERVRVETGLAVSVGIAPVKMVAKIASGRAKPDGLLAVAADEVRAFLDPLPVRALWGVGPVAEATLLRAGVQRVGDLARADPSRIEAWLGDWGRHVARLARGDDLREVEPYRPAVSMSEENTFAEDVSDPARLEAAILAHAESVARRLRRTGLVARTVVLKLKGARRRAPGPRGHPLWTRRQTLGAPTDDGEVLARTARELLRRAGLEEPVRLLGVGVTGLLPADAEARQLALDLAGASGSDSPGDGGEAWRARRRRLNRAVDDITERFGRDALRRAGAGGAERAGLSDRISRGETEPPG